MTRSGETYEGDEGLQSYHKQGLRDLRLAALTALGTITRALMDACATVHLISKERDARTRKLSNLDEELEGWLAPATKKLEEHDLDENFNKLAKGEDASVEVIMLNDEGGGGDHGGDQESEEGETETEGAKARGRESPVNDHRHKGQHGEEASPETESVVRHHKTESGSSQKTLGRRGSVRVRYEMHMAQQEHLEEALRICETKGLKKCMRFLVEKGYIGKTPSEFTNWIRQHLENIDQSELGNYISEEGTSEKESFHGCAARDVYWHAKFRGHCLLRCGSCSSLISLQEKRRKSHHGLFRNVLP